jgi:hypothetical protein
VTGNDCKPSNELMVANPGGAAIEAAGAVSLLSNLVVNTSENPEGTFRPLEHFSHKTNQIKNLCKPGTAPP